MWDKVVGLHASLALVTASTLADTERTYGALFVVLVINDNPYGLMVALSYMCRTCPQTMLEPYVGFKVVIRRQ
jgi:hypothetical protein